MDDDCGVYFLANDAVLDQTIAFLNSFRRYNPTGNLCLIPFDDAISNVSSLRHRYGFSMWPDDDVLRQCDSISQLFHGRRLGHYRKLAVWTGPFDRFIYIDCDTVVLGGFDRIFGVLDRFDVVMAVSDAPDSRHWVWKDSIDAAGALDRRQLAFAANGGFFVSRHGFLTLDTMSQRMPAALALAPHMELSCYDQPLLNYMIVTSGGRYTSLRVLAGAGDRADIPVERWAGEPGMVVRDGRVVDPDSPPALVMHWAGRWDHCQRTGDPLPYRELWEFYRYL